MMKRTELLLLVLMSVCAVTMISACGKGDNDGTVSAVAPTDLSYSYNQTYCSQQIIDDYEQLNSACDDNDYRHRDSRYSKRNRRQCQAMVQVFLSQYPRINCVIQVDPSKKSYKNTLIAEERIRRSMETQ